MVRPVPLHHRSHNIGKQGFIYSGTGTQIYIILTWHMSSLYDMLVNSL